MPTLTITKNWSDGSALTDAHLDTASESIETFVNTTKLDSNNLQSGAVVEATLGSASVTEAKIGTGAVTTTKLGDSSVTYAKTASDTRAYFVPTGGVLAYGGTSAPAGFLMCDGSAVSRTTYSALFAIIASAHGSGDGSTTFNLPNYQGRFLRGVDGSAGVDPDKASRTAMASGGNTGNNVGSVQADQVENHTHAMTMRASASAFGSDVPTLGSGGSGSSFSTNADGGGNETRPVNAYVYWIIKT